MSCLYLNYIILFCYSIELLLCLYTKWLKSVPANSERSLRRRWQYLLSDRVPLHFPIRSYLIQDPGIAFGMEKGLFQSARSFHLLARTLHLTRIMAESASVKPRSPDFPFRGPVKCGFRFLHPVNITYNTEKFPNQTFLENLKPNHTLERTELGPGATGL